MKYFLLVSLVSVIAIRNVKSQYNEPPEVQGDPNEGIGNPYYENEAPAPAGPQYGGHDAQHEGQQEKYQPRQPEGIRPPPRQPYPRQPPPQQQQDNHQYMPSGAGRQPAVAITNETFTLPSFYQQVTSTVRTIKINRRTYPEMIDILVRDGALKTPRVIEAFSKVERGYFVHPLEEEPYGFMVRKMGRGVFLEKPHFQAKIIEHLESKIKEGAKVLDLGSGTGFMSCVMAELAGKTGKVFAIEHMKDACEDSWDNIMDRRPDLLNDGRLHIRCKDARVGLVSQAPYDAIYMSPYLPDIPYAILLQLKPGGRLICGIGKTRIYHRLVIIDRSEDGKTFTKWDGGLDNFINPLVNALDQNDNWLYQQSRRRIIEAKNQGFAGIHLARKLKLFTKKPVDFRKLEDDTFKFIEV